METVKFNELSLVKRTKKLETYYDDELTKFNNSLSAVASSYPTQLKASGDEISLQRDGKVRVLGAVYHLSEFSLGQMLDFLGMPRKFCSRMSNPIFVDLFNKMLGENYDKSFSIRVISIDKKLVVVGFYPYGEIELPHTYNLFQSILRDKSQKTRKTVFMAGTVYGETSAMYLVFTDYKNYDAQLKDTFKGNYIWPGVEILYSPTWEVKPTVTACVMGEKYVALDKTKSYRFDVKSSGITKILPAIETFIMNVKSDSKELVEGFEKSFDELVSEDLDKFIRTKLPKVVSSELVSESFTGKKVGDVLGEISRRSENDTLSRRRKTILFVGDIVRQL